MPAIRGISFDKNMLKIVDHKTTHSFDISKIPPDKDTIQKAETHTNSTWIPSLNITEYQLEVHIFSVSPLVLTVYAADIGIRIPQDWWVEDTLTVIAGTI